MTFKSKKTAEQYMHVPGFHVEMDGGAKRMAIQLSGINSIKDFSESEVLLRVRGFFVKINGDSLSLAIYENRTVEIVGKVISMELLYDKS